MNFEVGIVNPRTSEQRRLIVELSSEQAAAAKSAPCLQSYVQLVAHPQIPQGFLPIGNGVRPVTLQ
jgi:hypothetical protein